MAKYSKKWQNTAKKWRNTAKKWQNTVKSGEIQQKSGEIQREVKKQAGAELGQAQPKLGLKVGVCILGWRLKHEVEF